VPARLPAGLTDILLRMWESWSVLGAVPGIGAHWRTERLDWASTNVVGAIGSDSHQISGRSGMKRETCFAVIGAGLGGATAAAWLQREGFPVQVYEQAQSFERIGAGIHVSANVIKVLRRLGAEQRLNQIGIHPDIFTSRKWDTGDVLFELPLGEIGERKYGAGYITVHRHDLHAAILEKVEPGTIAFGRRLADVKQDGNVVQMSFADGSEAEANVVIGADGVNSKLREAVVGPSQSRFSGAIAHRAIYPSRLLGGMQVRNCTKWWGPNSDILIYYIEQSRDEIYLVTSAKGEWHSRASWEFCPREEVIKYSDGSRCCCQCRTTQRITGARPSA
jgi:6-hydroxynicotinate 3-monooxygenase